MKWIKYENGEYLLYKDRIWATIAITNLEIIHRTTYKTSVVAPSVFEVNFLLGISTYPTYYTKVSAAKKAIIEEVKFSENYHRLAMETGTPVRTNLNRNS